MGFFDAVRQGIQSKLNPYGSGVRAIQNPSGKGFLYIPSSPPVITQSYPQSYVYAQYRSQNDRPNTSNNIPPSPPKRIIQQQSNKFSYVNDWLNWKN